jgi:hypothetical protein
MYMSMEHRRKHHAIQDLGTRLKRTIMQPFAPERRHFYREVALSSVFLNVILNSTYLESEYTFSICIPCNKTFLT